VLHLGSRGCRGLETHRSFFGTHLDFRVYTINFLVDINNWYFNQELWNEKGQSIFICCLYNVFALSMLDEFAFKRWKKGSNINFLL